MNAYLAAQTVSTQPLISDPVAISIVTAIGGVIVAYLTYVKSQKVQAKKTEKRATDPMLDVIDGYEKLIAQKDAQNERDARQIKAMAEEMELMRDVMRKLENRLQESQRAHERAVHENAELKTEIRKLRTEYQAAKKAEINPAK